MCVRRTSERSVVRDRGYHKTDRFRHHNDETRPQQVPEPPHAVHRVPYLQVRFPVARWADGACSQENAVFARFALLWIAIP